MKRIGLSAPTWMRSLMVNTNQRRHTTSRATHQRRFGSGRTLLLIGLSFVLQPLLVAELGDKRCTPYRRPSACRRGRIPCIVLRRYRRRDSAASIFYVAVGMAGIVHQPDVRRQTNERNILDRQYPRRNPFRCRTFTVYNRVRSTDSAGYISDPPAERDHRSHLWLALSEARLESAMISHFSADIVLHVLLAL